MKDTINIEKKVTIKMYPAEGLKPELIGGVIVYCNGFKTMFDNTLKARLNLIFEESVPDVRKIMFKSLNK